MKRALVTLAALAALLTFTMWLVPGPAEAGPSTWTNGSFGGAGGSGFPDGGVIGAGALPEITLWANASTLYGDPNFNYVPATNKFGQGTTAPIFAHEVSANAGDPTLPRIEALFFGAGGPAYIGVGRGQGTHAVPAALNNGDLLGYYTFYGQDRPGVGNMTSSTLLEASATENWNPGARGSNFIVRTTKTGTTTFDPRITVDGLGNVTIANDLIAGELVTFTQQTSTLSAIGPTVVALSQSNLQASCTIADCGFTLDELDAAGVAIVDGTIAIAHCASTTTGTCTFPNVAGQQLNTGGVSVVLSANGVVQYIYSATASAWIQMASTSITTGSIVVTGTASFNGAVNIGDAAGDVVTVNGTPTFKTAITVDSAGGTNLTIAETGLTRAGADIALTAATVTIDSAGGTNMTMDETGFTRVGADIALTSTTTTISSILRVTPGTFAATDCDAAGEVGRIVMHNDGANHITACFCVQTAAATFSFAPVPLIGGVCP